MKTGDDWQIFSLIINYSDQCIRDKIVPGEALLGSIKSKKLAMCIYLTEFYKRKNISVILLTIVVVIFTNYVVFSRVCLSWSSEGWQLQKLLLSITLHYDIQMQRQLCPVFYLTLQLFATLGLTCVGTTQAWRKTSKRRVCFSPALFFWLDEQRRKTDNLYKSNNIFSPLMACVPKPAARRAQTSAWAWQQTHVSSDFSFSLKWDQKDGKHQAAEGLLSFSTKLESTKPTFILRKWIKHT